MALLLRRQHPHRPDGGCRHHGARDGRLRARQRRRLSQLPAGLSPSARGQREVLLLEAGRGHRGHAELHRQFQARGAARRARAADGSYGRQGHPRPCARCTSRADARPLHAVCRLEPLPRPRRAVQHRRHAGVGGHLVSGRRHARRCRRSGGAGPRSRRRSAHRQRGDRDRDRPRRSAQRHREWRAHSLRCADLQHGCGAHLYRAGAWRARAPHREEGLRARLLGRRALSWSQPALRPPRPSRLRLLPQCGGRVRRHLSPRRPRPRPDRLSLRPLGQRPERRAGRRRGALRPGPHAASAPGPGLVGDVRALSPGDPRQAEAYGGARGHRGPHRRRARPDAAGHPRPVQGAGRGDLRACLARCVARCLQAVEPLEDREGPVSLRWRFASRPWHADGHDVRLDRRRRAGPRPWRAWHVGRRRPRGPADALRAAE
jgi:hypothetical protein